MEERNNLNSKGDVGVDRKPMGLQDEYKKSWR